MDFVYFINFMLKSFNEIKNYHSMKPFHEGG